MISKPKNPVIPLDDATACQLIIERARRENRSRRNALVTTVLEAFGCHPTTNNGNGQAVKPTFRDDITEK